MDDLVKEALEQATETEGADTPVDEFGAPQFCYLGYGTHGCDRVDTGLADRSYTHDPPGPLETYVETYCFKSDLTGFETESEQTYNRTALQDVVADADVCLLTADCSEPSIDSLIRTTVTDIDDRPVIALLSSDGDACGGLHRQFDDVTQIHFDTATIESVLEDSDAIETVQTTDQLITQFVTDMIAIPTVPSTVAVDYQAVRNIWESGGLATPFVAHLDRTELTVERIKSAITPIGPRADSPKAENWFGYATAGRSVTLRDFDAITSGLSQTVTNNETDRTLGLHIDDKLDDSITLRGIWVT